MPNPDALAKEIEERSKEIRTESLSMSIGELISLYRDKELDIHPEFQRFFRWSPLQKSKFIESLLLGIPIPPIFVSQRADGVWDVVDGVQRLSTVFEFVGTLMDKNGMRLQPSTLVKTDYLPSLDGIVWQDDQDPNRTLPNALRLDLKRRKLDINIIRKESDDNAKYDLFERLNTLGSHLSDQEVRNCLLVMMNPAVHEWLELITSSESFQSTTSLTDRSLQERYDVELTLRFILLSRADEASLQNIKDVDAFITQGMRQLAQDGDFDTAFEKEVFDRTFDTLAEVIGPECFTRLDGGRGRGGFLISVFEVLAAGLGWRIRTSPERPIDRERLANAVALIGTSEDFRRYSRSGTSASSRIPRLVPLGRRLFGGV